MLRLPLFLLRSLTIGAVALGGLIASVLLYRNALSLERARFGGEVRRQIENRHALIRESLRGCDEALFALRLLFDGSDDVSPSEFKRASAEVSRRHAGVFAFAWLPRVAASDRAAWEAAHGPATGGGLPIQEHSADGSLHLAGPRPEYFPVLYCEPTHAEWNPVGCNLGAGRLGAVLAEARRTRRETMSGRITLLTRDGNRPGVLLAVPVFSVRDSSVLRGFLISVFQLDDLLAAAWRNAPESVTDVMIVDDQAEAAGGRPLYYHSAVPESAPAPTEAQFREIFHRSLPLEVGGRHWLALYRVNPAAALPTHRLPGVLLASSLIITFLLTAYLTLSARHTRVVEREVTERTAELSESRRQLDTLIQSLPGMVYRGRLRGHEVEMQYVSEGVLPLTGCRPGELLSGAVQFRDLINPEDRIRTSAAIETALLHDRRPFEVEYRLRERDGRVNWVLSRGRGVYDAAGGLLFFEGIAIDISAQRQAEAERIAIERRLLDSQKLESLGLLAGGIAHDFNNLLAGVLGNAGLARLQLDGNASVGEHLQKIESAATRAAELCQQMLAYSGRGRFLVEPVDLNQLVRDTLPLLHGALSTHAQLELSLAPAAPHVLADATQIRQIVMNLIINAGDALGSAPGDVIVSSGIRTVDLETLHAARGGEQLEAGTYAFLEVRDTGCGMTPATIARIFDPFFTTKFTGRGLGLAAVLGIVRGHSGALHVDSAPDAGSTFTLFLPALTDHVAPARRTPDAAPPWRGTGRVLVIDDEAPVRDVAAGLLRTFGYAVECAADGADGVACFRQAADEFEFVLLDFTMPGMNGEETLAALRAISSRARVILMSGYSESDRLTRLGSDGPLGFLQKPFTRALLEQKLRELFA